MTGTLAEKVSRLQQTSTFIRWVERIGGGLMLAAAVYLLYQTAWYAGWLSS